MSAAKGRKLVQVLAALAVLAAVALPAGASIPQPGVQLPEPNSAALLAAARDASSPAIKAARDRGFELFSAPLGDRFRLDLHAAVDAPAQARFHLLTPRKSRIRGVNLPEPLLIGVELPPSRTAFRLYGDVPYGFASGGLYITTDPLGYVDGPNLYQYGLNNPVSFSDPMGLCFGLKKFPGPCGRYADDVTEAVSTFVLGALNLHEGRLSTSLEDLNDPKKGEVIADSLGMVAGAPLTLGEASGEWVATIDAIYRTPDTDERLALYEELQWQTPGMVLEVSAVGEGVNFSFAAARRAPGVLLREIGEQGVGVVDDALQGRSSGNLFHYTRSDVAPLIEGGGLRPGADGKIYLTPRGDLSPLQAQIDLALPPNRGLPDALFEVDVVGLDRLGIPRSAPQQTTRMFNMPGGGQEVVVPYAIPSEVLKRVR